MEGSERSAAVLGFIIAAIVIITVVGKLLSIIKDKLED